MNQPKGKKTRTEAEIRKLVAGYKKRNQTRAAYCASHGLPLSTLDYYLRRSRAVGPALVEVDVRASGATAATSPAPQGAVALVLGNGKRVEIEWAGLANVPAYGQPLRTLLAWLEEA